MYQSGRSSTEMSLETNRKGFFFVCPVLFTTTSETSLPFGRNSNKAKIYLISVYEGRDLGEEKQGRKLSSTA